MPARDRILEYLYRWATTRLPMDASKAMVEEVFLWGVQTAQAMQRISADSPEFIVHAGLILSNRGRHVLGWHLERKDGTPRRLLYSKEDLRPVKRKRRKLRERVMSKASKSGNQQPDDRGQLFS
jgi:hypothetical protein